MNEINECPACGGNSIFDKFNDDDKYSQMYCQDCGVSGPICKGGCRKAIEAWNKLYTVSELTIAEIIGKK